VNVNGSIFYATSGLSGASASWAGNVCTFTHTLGTSIFNIVLTPDSGTAGGIGQVRLLGQTSTTITIETYDDEFTLPDPLPFFLMIQIP
jgi:hypothetical protein